MVPCNVYSFIQTWFVGESGRDTGGVTRELWRLMTRAVFALCEGDQKCRTFRHDSERVGVYYHKSRDFAQFHSLVTIGALVSLWGCLWSKVVQDCPFPLHLSMITCVGRMCAQFSPVLKKYQILTLRVF